MIPKRIIYIWFGRGEKNELIQKCMTANRSVLKEWSFEEYTEDNYDIHSCKYMEEAYQRGKYAFASEFARFDILYQRGGVYVDTDVEFLKDMPDSMLCQKGFTGVEGNNKIAPGLVFAAEAGNDIVREIVESYQAESFVLPNGELNTRTVVSRVTEIFEKHGFKADGSEQEIEGIHIFPFEYFCAYDFVTEQFEITENTYSIHHYAASWLSLGERVFKCFRRCVRCVVGKRNYRKIIAVKRRLFGVRE